MNEAYIRQMQGMQNNAIRQTFRKSGQMLPFISTAQLANGTYRFRIWPTDSKKNPVGWLFYKSHEITLESDRDTELVQCPRSNNWDPLPLYYEDSLGGRYTEPVEGMDLRAIYKERCWCCELLEEVHAMGIRDRLPEHLQGILAKIYGPGRNCSGAEKVHFPVTIQMSIVGREMIEGSDGKPYEQITYGPNIGNNFHCDFDLTPGIVTKSLFEIIQLIPNVMDLAMGRWILMTKENDGKGAGGYRLQYEPNPTPLGFQIPEEMYPNYWKWGAGSPQKPSRRKTYLQVESLVLSKAYWADDIRRYGVPLSDAEAAQMSQPGYVPF